MFAKWREWIDWVSRISVAANHRMISSSKHCKYRCLIVFLFAMPYFVQVAACSMVSNKEDTELTISNSNSQVLETVTETSEYVQSTILAVTLQTTASTLPIESVQSISDISAFSVVDISSWSEYEIRDCFYYEEITDEIFARMDGKSFKADCTTERSDLRYIRVLHVDFDGNTRVGEFVANKKMAQDIVDVFYELFLASYPIEKIVLVDDYDADDNLSMADNNTSCFNFRRVAGTSSLSRHALGMAIDINPLYNPWIYERDGVTIIDPPGATPYVDRQGDSPYIIDHDDLCYKLFIQHGFKWGGDWSNSKDYQHFSKDG